MKSIKLPIFIYLPVQKDRLKYNINTIMKNTNSRSPCQLPQEPLPLISASYKNLLSAKGAKERAKDSQALPNGEFKQSKIINQNTNYTTAAAAEYQEIDPERKNQEELDEERNEDAIGFYQAKKMMSTLDQMRQEESNTRPIRSAKKMQKIKVLPTDEDPTVKVSQVVKSKITAELKKDAVYTEKKNREAKQAKKKLNHVQVGGDNQVTMKLSIPCNKKVQQIFQKQPLRIRFSALLRDHQKYEMGYHHIRLIKLLKMIDHTIEFVSMNTERRIYFYADLKKNIYDNGRFELTHKHIQQMLFIDDQLFRVEWEHNMKIRTYDLMITLPQIKSEDQRLENFRKGIIQYLLVMEVQFLAEKKQEKIAIDQWTEGFSPNSYQIPMKSLPPHPFVKDAEVSSFSKEKLQSVQNPRLKQQLMNRKYEADSKSLRSEDVAQMIFSKQSNASIREKLLDAIKQRQAQMLQKAKINPEAVDAGMVLKVCQDILVVYMSKSVSNIAKTTLIDLVDRRSSFKPKQILESIELILQARQVAFLKQIRTSSGIVVLQIDRTKFNDIKKHLKQLKFD